MVGFTPAADSPRVVRIQLDGAIEVVVERAQTSFEDALDRARPMASSLVRKLRDIGDAAGNPPDEVQVEFGIVLNAEAGAVLASASAEANYKVTMTWK